MNKLFRGRTAAHIYREQLAYVLGGEEVEVNGRPTRERLNVITEITEPWHHITTVPGRRLNPWIAISEILWLLSGRDDVAALLPYNKNILRFSDDQVTMYGAYGRRFADQIAPLIARLRKNPTDRRAVLSIWRPADLMSQTKDPPCNDLLFFKLRQGKLYMTVMCRSNDIHWGLNAVNLPQFGALQAYIATWLDVDMGTQTHFSNSLHVYTDKEGQAITDRMMEYADEEINIITPGLLFGIPPALIFSAYPHWCSQVLDGTYMGRDPFLMFAYDFLKAYTSANGDMLEEIDKCRNADLFEDWIQAAHTWV